MDFSRNSWFIREMLPDCILSFAQKENMEVIVMGTHGRRGFDRLVLGSTTDRVMRKAACPVLVVSQCLSERLALDPRGATV